MGVVGSRVPDLMVGVPMVEGSRRPRLSRGEGRTDLGRVEARRLWSPIATGLMNHPGKGTTRTMLTIWLMKRMMILITIKAN